MSSRVPPQLCPDTGACHHACTRRCFRVDNCAPLSAAGWGASWPASVRANPRPMPVRPALWAAALSHSQGEPTPGEELLAAYALEPPADRWERRALRLERSLSVERRRVIFWVNVAGLLAVLLLVAVAAAVTIGLYL